jgi:hypothetical protein
MAAHRYCDVMVEILGAFVCAAGCVGAFGGLVFLVLHLRRQAVERQNARLATLSSWAAAYGWQFYHRPQVSWSGRLPQGDRRAVLMAMVGMIGGRPVTVAEYTYVEEHMHHMTGIHDVHGGPGHRSETSYHLVVAIVYLRQPGPSMTVFRRGGLSRLGRGLFGDGATAIGNEPFDRDYRLRAHDAAQARAVMTPELVHAQVAGHVPAYWSLAGNELLAYRHGRVADPNTIPAEVAPLQWLADRLDGAPR